MGLCVGMGLGPGCNWDCIDGYASACHVPSKKRSRRQNFSATSAQVSKSERKDKSVQLGAGSSSGAALHKRKHSGAHALKRAMICGSVS